MVPGRLSLIRRAFVVTALIVIAAAWLAVLATRQGLELRDVRVDGLPLRYMAPAAGEALPGVVVAHGFSGSRQLMLGYGTVLARAGYAVVLLDFAGHGANAQPLASDGDALQEDLARATAYLLAQPAVDPDRVALLGHSMGSGAVLKAAVAAPDRYQATVAISPTGAEVSAAAPRNLLLQAGALEPLFGANALALLAAAGGPNDDFEAGLARDYLEVPRVEHITILFSDVSHSAALAWIGAALGGPISVAYRDRRMLWYLLQLGAGLLLSVAAAPALRLPEAAGQPIGHWRRRLAPPAGGVLAGGALWLLNLAIDVPAFAGLRVGGGLAVWFFFFGLFWLLLRGDPLPAPDRVGLLWGVLLFAYMWALFGLLAQIVWLPWLLVPRRLLLWLLCAALCLPWQLAAAGDATGAARPYRIALWLAHSVVVVVGLLLLLPLLPAMGFIVLIVPVIPLMLALLGVQGAQVDRVWSVGLANALFFGWLIALLFPLAA